MTLRRRLLIATGVAMLIGLVVVGITTYTLVTRSQLNQIDDELQRTHSPVEDLAQADPSAWALIPEVAPRLYVAILDPSGQAMYTTPVREDRRDDDDNDDDDGPANLDLIDLNDRQRYQTLVSDTGDEVRVRVDGLEDGRTLVLGQSLHDINETQQRLLTALVIASLAAIAAVLLLSWWLIRLGLRPLHAIEASAAEISDSELSDRRVEGADAPTEVGSVARALNAMLDRLDGARTEREQTMHDLQASESRMRQFVADASHELRTPLAATAAYAELFEHGARNHPADLERSMTGIRNETARMAELVDDLLQLARIDEHRPLAQGDVDLTDIVLASLDAARAVDPERSFTPQLRGVISVRGDGARLRQVVDNLLANVRRHTPTSTRCVITLAETDDSAILTVADQGPGVTDDQLAHLGDRFYRVDTARTRSSGGNGLGLAIAKAITEAHGGSLVASHNQPQGLVVTVTVPKERQPETALKP